MSSRNCQKLAIRLAKITFRLGEQLSRIFQKKLSLFLGFILSGGFLGIFLAPLLYSLDLPARLLYSVWALNCHQIPERSFLLFGFPLAVCARCTGFYCGLLISLVAKFRFKRWKVPAAVVGSFFLLLPGQWLVQLAGWWSPSNLWRFVFGLLFGLLPALIMGYFSKPSRPILCLEGIVPFKESLSNRRP